MFKKITLLSVLAVLCLYFTVLAQQRITITGNIVNADGQPISGATIATKDKTSTAQSDKDGNFRLPNVAIRSGIVITNIGYVTKEIITDRIALGKIVLEAVQQNLQEVEIVNTGYQALPKERATGSFEVVGHKLIERSQSFNILERLNAIASGLLVNSGLPTQGGANNAKIAIHGRSTIFANAEPLIILDGMPYEGNINQINPADIENITLLKDAAAASIWGTRASNGVIVLVSKGGKYNNKREIGYMSSYNITAKPDLYYNKGMDADAYIDLEQFLFDRGFYTSAINSGYRAISPAVEIFNDLKNGQISSVTAADKIAELKQHDINSQLEDYLYRRKEQQQHHLNISGGSAQLNYYLSGTLQKSIDNLVTDSYKRTSLTNKNNYLLTKGLNLSTDLNFSSAETRHKTDVYIPFTPYDQIADEQGRPLVVTTAATFRPTYTDTAGGGYLLDWKYKPLGEFTSNAKIKEKQYRAMFGLRYAISPMLSVQANYQWLAEWRDQERHYDLDRYYTRNFINKFSTFEAGQLLRKVPLGDIMEMNKSELTSHNFRLQANIDKSFGHHHILFIGGYEQQESKKIVFSQNMYGYDPDTRLNGNAGIDPSKQYPLYYAPELTEQIGTFPSMSHFQNFNQSFYGNFSYTFHDQYIFSASARKDESNLFGVESNRKGVPLWSVGLSWLLKNKQSVPWLNELKLRATYGYNGNVDKTVSGVLTFRNSGLLNIWGSNYSRIASPLNPYLTWEQVGNTNLGIDLAVFDHRIKASIDIYERKAKNLIGNHPIAPQSGLTQFKGNGATILTRGLDVMLNTHNLKGSLNWLSSLLVSYNKDKVTSYKTRQSSNYSIISQNFGNPLEGYPYYAVYSFPSAGLNDKGLPRGFLQGNISDDYTTIINQLDPAQIVYHGSASPVWFGNLLNTIRYHNIELSFNIIFKLDYYFRRTNVFSGGTYNHTVTDFEKRWQKAGDEAYTVIPALVYPNNSAMTSFFQFSSDLVERSDHVRLNDIRIMYSFGNSALFFKKLRQVQLYAQANNVGIIWKKNNIGLDPDVVTSGIPAPFTTTIGLNIKL